MGYEPYEWFNICEGLKEELRKKEEKIEELQDENYGWFSLYDLQDVEIYNLKEKIEYLEKEKSELALELISTIGQYETKVKELEKLLEAYQGETNAVFEIRDGKAVMIYN